MDLPLDDRLRIGVQTIHRRTEPADGPWLPTIDEMRTWSSWSTAAATIRCGWATTSPSRSRSSIRCSSLPRPRS